MRFSGDADGEPQQPYVATYADCSVQWPPQQRVQVYPVEVAPVTWKSAGFFDRNIFAI
jgi:hypothetical protein